MGEPLLELRSFNGLIRLQAAVEEEDLLEIRIKRSECAVRVRRARQIPPRRMMDSLAKCLHILPTHLSARRTDGRTN